MYINQRDIEGWEEHGCGVACVLMSLHMAGKDFDRGNVIQELVDIGAYVADAGWKHAAMARVLANFDLSAYNQEFSNEFGIGALKEKGLRKIQRELLKGNAVIISATLDSMLNDHPTNILLNGIEEDHIILQDPDNKKDNGENEKIHINKLKEAWSSLAIFIELDV